MQKTRISNKVLQKRIPTLVGIGVLVLGLIAGTILFSQGTGMFAPRATPQTTPKNVRVTNVTDSTFTVSFLTDAQTSSSVNYGTSPDNLGTKAMDDRVQLSADTDLTFTLHHITVRGLQPNTTYHYVLGSNGAEFDQEGVPFTVKTASKDCTVAPQQEPPTSCTPPAARTINGVVLNENSSPAVNSVVYITLPGAGEMSALIRNQSGNWAVPLSDARTTDGSAYVVARDTDLLSIFVQGPQPAQSAQFNTTVAESQPVQTITFGQTSGRSTTISDESGTARTASPSPVVSPSPSSTIASRNPDATDSANKTALDPSRTSTSSGSSRPPSDTGVLEEEDPSDDTSGTDTDETDTDTEDTSSRQLAQAVVTPSPTPRISPRPTPSPTPFGTNNPFPVRSSTPSATATASATPSATPKATASASTSSLPVSGTVGTTLLLIIGGGFFMIAGAWSFWVGNSLSKENS